METETAFGRKLPKANTEEGFNSLTHLIGAVLIFIGGAFLIMESALQKDVWKIVSFGIYIIFVMLMFTFSSIYHGIKKGEKHERRLRTLDYLGVFLAISGSFIPICLVLLRGVFGWTLFGLVAFLTIVGISLRIFARASVFITGTFQMMIGLLGLVIVPTLFRISEIALYLFLAGGLSYIIGFIILATRWPNIIRGKFGFHEIWHIFVLLGALFHFLLMWFYVLPY
jgi:hemolysin III